MVVWTEFLAELSQRRILWGSGENWGRAPGCWGGGGANWGGAPGGRGGGGANWGGGVWGFGEV